MKISARKTDGGRNLLLHPIKEAEFYSRRYHSLFSSVFHVRKCYIFKLSIILLQNKNVPGDRHNQEQADVIVFVTIELNYVKFKQTCLGKEEDKKCRKNCGNARLDINFN